MARRGGLGPRGIESVESAAAQLEAMDNQRASRSATRSPEAQVSRVSAQPQGVQGPATAGLQYMALGTSNPARPRCAQAAYDADNGVIYVRFARTPPYEYGYPDCTQDEWEQFVTNYSPGRYINSTLNQKDYFRVR